MDHLSHEGALAAYEARKAAGLSLNMARGKPAPAQLDLSNAFFTAVTKDNFISEDGVDTRNYGELKGLRESRELMAGIMGVPFESVVIAGCSSLTVMYDVHTRLLITAAPGAEKPWFEVADRKCLCPSPGYDRHFQMTEGLGYDLVTVPMTDSGPDMDLVEKLVASDASVKCMWCVPKYSNPTGATYSEEVCRRLASMKAAAPDFRIFWDNAYAVHHLYPDQPDTLPDILKLAAEAGNPDRFLVFSSTSKITFAGGGISAFASSPANLEWFAKQQKLQMICTDKVNQLRHARFFPDFSALEAHMRREAEILRPKFEAFLDTLDRRLKGVDGVRWFRPRGGYFIGIYLPNGTAKRVVQLADEAGMKLTPAGNTYPHNTDPDDSFLRLAPSFPTLEEIRAASELFCDCVLLAASERKKA